MKIHGIIILILYKEIPEFKLQNYDMTMNEFKIILGGSGYIDFLVDLSEFLF